MENYSLLLLYLSAFGVIALASKQFGQFFSRFKLPLISGFLVAGIIAGPFVLGMIPEQAVGRLRFLDQISLAFIAFAAGGELYLSTLRGKLGSIAWIIVGQAVAVFVLGALAFIWLAGSIPFMQALAQPEIIAVALLGAVIMVARSPSTALAIIKEVRAKGPFTQKILGTTVLKDALVILLFAATVSVAAVLVEGGEFNSIFLLFIAFEIALDILLGLIIGQVLKLVMQLPWRKLQGALILTVGYGIFFLSSTLHDAHLFSLPIGIFSEPLLIGMVAGFYVANFTERATEFHKLTEDMAPGVFIVFFTLVGLSLEIDLLTAAVGIMFLLLLVRIFGIFLGSFLGGMMARDPFKHNVLLGMAFITQAGVSVGLAKEIGVEFSPWGNDLATISIGIIVVNQIIGPPFLKWALDLVGESRERAEASEFDGTRDVVIFGLEDQSLALTRQLHKHGWHVIVASRKAKNMDNLDAAGVVIRPISDITLEDFQELELEKADAVVALLSDEENYKICELIYENFGTEDMIVRLNDRKNFERFHELGALIVDPSTAIVSLLDHLVRSPVAASLLLGLEEGQDMVEVSVRNRNLHGVALRDLDIPLDALILSVHRDGRTIVSHGYTRLQEGDEVTVFGSGESIEEVMIKFGDY